MIWFLRVWREETFGAFLCEKDALKAVYRPYGYQRGDKERSCHAYRGDWDAVPLVPLNEASPDMGGMSGL
jgi:hypothetical protein